MKWLCGCCRLCFNQALMKRQKAFFN
ncbi:helix-turn-helix domain-containing protein [Helicobacter pylori]|nr:helix-turn-helix domain-containing protein [Helicobacter pylori]